MTARANEHDRVEVLSLGADDVMCKPFSMRELLARVTAALRRTAAESARSKRLPIAEGDLSIDPGRMSVIVAGRPSRRSTAWDTGSSPRPAGYPGRRPAERGRAPSRIVRDAGARRGADGCRDGGLAAGTCPPEEDGR